MISRDVSERLLCVQIDGEVMICLPAASPTAADRLTSLDQLDSKAKIMAWPASRFDAGGTAAAEAEALAEQSAAVLDAAAVTAAAVRAEEEAEAAAAEEAHLDVEIAAAQAAADEAEAYAEAAASVEMVRGKVGWLRHSHIVYTCRRLIDLSLIADGLGVGE